MNKQLLELAELAWGVIANASGGNWDRQSQEWQEAAIRWRERWREASAATTTTPFARRQTSGEDNG